VHVYLAPSPSTSGGDASSVSDVESPELTLEQQFNAIMQQSVSVQPAGAASSTASSSGKILAALIKAEMAVFESSGTRGRCLEQVYKYLLTIPPTSVEAERAFSASGALCTKVRSRLDDNTLDTLCFLRAHYGTKTK
jgi:hypothetical protein